MKLFLEVECTNIGPLQNTYNIVELIGGIASTAGSNSIRVCHAFVTNNRGRDPQSPVEGKSLSKSTRFGAAQSLGRWSTSSAEMCTVKEVNGVRLMVRYHFGSRRETQTRSSPLFLYNPPHPLFSARGRSASGGLYYQPVPRKPFQRLCQKLFISNDGFRKPVIQLLF